VAEPEALEFGSVIAVVRRPLQAAKVGEAKRRDDVDFPVIGRTGPVRTNVSRACRRADLRLTGSWREWALFLGSPEVAATARDRAEAVLGSQTADRAGAGPPAASLWP
jgi:hypothetical protein